MSIRGALRFAALVLGSAVLMSGCKKEKESLVVFTLMVSVPTTIKTLDLSVMNVTKTFSVPNGVLSNNAKFGLYLPDSIKGTALFAEAVGRPPTGCRGLSGSSSALAIRTPGETFAVTIAMGDAMICAADGGAGGAGGGGEGGKTGTAGTTGFGGTTGFAGAWGMGGGGGRPPVVAPPSLASCLEYDHNPIGATCLPATGANNVLIHDVAVSPDGQFLATSGSNPDDLSGAGDIVRVWRLQNNVPTPITTDITEPGLGPAYVAFSPDSQILAVGWRHWYVDLFAAPTFEYRATIRSAPGDIYGTKFAPNGLVVTLDYDSVNDGHIYIDQPGGSAPLATIMAGVNPDALAVAPVFDANNNVAIAVAGWSGNAALHTLNGTSNSFGTPTIVTVTTTGDASWQAAFSADSRTFAAGANDGTVQFWSLPLSGATPAGTPIAGGNYITGLAFAPSGTVLGIGIWDTAEQWTLPGRTFSARFVAPQGLGVIAYTASGAGLIVGEVNCGKFLICAD